MKKFYYFSKTKLKFVEIENFYRKVILYSVLSSFLIALILFGSYFAIFNSQISSLENQKLKAENKALLSKLKETSQRIDLLAGKIDSLDKVNNAYRLAVNLEPIADSQKVYSIGGNLLSDIKISDSDDINDLLEEINFKIEELDFKIKLEANNYVEINNKIEQNKKLFDCIPAIKPAEGYFGDGFGLRRHPILKIKRMHTGLDIVCNVKTPVYATGDGKVVIAKRNGSMGRMVEIDHGFGYKTRYGHLYRIKVRKGQKVKRGDLIGLSGNSGLSTGPHLHYEVYHNGIALNPKNFIYDDINIFDIAKK